MSQDLRERSARLRARPDPTLDRAAEAPAAATHQLSPAGRRGALLHVPAGLRAGRPAPLVVMLHGAGGAAGHAIPMLVEQAERHDLLLLAPDSRGRTWDIILGRYGADVDFIDAMLRRVFAWFPVSRVAAAGFSDGASYALSLGLANGDLFSDVLAFSPGFAAPDPIVGRPRVFISHGDQDRVLPVQRCGRPIAARLKRAGYDVDYREFHGGHTAPHALIDQAVERFLS